MYHAAAEFVVTYPLFLQASVPRCSISHSRTDWKELIDAVTYLPQSGLENTKYGLSK